MPASFSIPLTGLAANDPVPGVYTEVTFAAGPATVGQQQYAILLIGNKTTAGDATTNTVIYGGPSSPLPLQTTQDFINRFGQGSELHRMAKRVLVNNTVTPIYAIAVTESGGAQATGTITITGVASGNATARTWVGDEFVDAAITNGDSVQVIAGNIAAAINTKLDWPVTAAVGAGPGYIITLTAKNHGTRGNWIRYACLILTPGGSITTASSATAPAFFTGGTTADTNVTALSTILPYRYYYIVSAAEDNTQLGAVVTQVNSQAQPTTGIRQRVYGGSIDSLANVTAITTSATLNAARAEVIWCQDCEVPPAELAAYWAGIIALEEASTPYRVNFDGYGNDTKSSAFWKLLAPRDGTNPTRATIKSALNNGITPVGVGANGATYVVSRITTRSLSGSANDYRIRDAHKVTICDRFADDLQTKFSLQFAGKKIADDPAPGQRIPGPTVVTPRVMQAAILKLIDDYDSFDLLQNASQIKANTQSIRESSPTTRLSARIPLQPIDVLHQTATAIDQVA